MATMATMHSPARPGAREASTMFCDAPWQLRVCLEEGTASWVSFVDRQQ